MLSRPGYMGQFGRINKPWYQDPNFAAIAEDGSIVYPSVIADFVNDRYAKADTPLGEVRETTFNGIFDQYSRASSGTYVNAQGIITTAAVNEYRRTYDPATLQCLGVLSEEDRPNLLTNSNTFNSGYAVENVTFTPGYTTILGLAGTLMIEGTGGAGHAITRTISFTSGTIYGLSVYAKQGIGTRNLRLALPSTAFGGATNAFFNLSDGSVVTTTGDPVAYTEYCGNGIYRCVIIKTAAATASSTILIHLASGTTISYFGNGTSGIVLAGAQLESSVTTTGLNFRASSYIPTEGIVLTRSNDTITSASLPFDHTNASVYIEGPVTYGGFTAAFNQQNNPRGHMANRYDQSQVFWVSGTGSNQCSASNLSPAGTNSKTIGLYSGAPNADIMQYVKDGIAAPWNGSNIDQVGTRIYVARRAGFSGQQHSNTTTKFFAIYPKKLLESEGIRLTA